MLITAILVQRTTGGNLSEVLDKTAQTMTERERIRGDILTLTASQRLTGLILSVYPAAIGLLFLAIMPHEWSKLFTEAVGQILLGIAVGLQLIGFIVIRRTLNVEI
jgi:tight adherence protein B